VRALLTRPHAGVLLSSGACSQRRTTRYDTALPSLPAVTVVAGVAILFTVRVSASALRLPMSGGCALVVAGDELPVSDEQHHTYPLSRRLSRRITQRI